MMTSAYLEMIKVNGINFHFAKASSSIKSFRFLKIGIKPHKKELFGKSDTYKELFVLPKMEPDKRPEDVVTVDVQVAKDLLQKGHLYLDVRSVEEYNKSHVENALNVPYMFITPQGRVKNPDFLAQVSSVLKKEDHLVVACNSGGRALRACVDLLNAGFEHVSNMGGGYSAWVDSAFAGDKPPEELKIACKFRG